jgi:hypothetical protein
MPQTSDAELARINKVLETWQQGDLVRSASLPFAYFADAARPLSASAQKTVSADDSGLTVIETDEVGFVILTQTCDVVRSCADRPFLELAPLVLAPAPLIEEARRLKRASLAYHPAAARHGLLVDLDRTMTVEKAVVADIDHERGLATDDEMVAFQQALASKRARFAFSNEFVAACTKFAKRMKDRAGKQTAEGRHVDALDEIRVAASPNWTADTIELTFWLIKRGEPPAADWPAWTAEWTKLFDRTPQLATVQMRAVTLDDMTARDHVESHHLDFDQLSVPKL